MKINEIITVAELVEPPDYIKQIIVQQTINHFQDNIFYTDLSDPSGFIVAAKKDNELLAYVAGVKYTNKKFADIPSFIVPQNIYSWVTDRGTTALTILKTLIKLAKMPVLSDVEMTPAAKRFIQKNIENQNLAGKEFDLNTGTVSAYDKSIWTQESDSRVLILEQLLGKTVGSFPFPIYSGQYNYTQLLK